MMKEMPEQNARETRGQAFVRYVIDRCNKDKGVAACMRRADNPAMQHQSWNILIDFHVNLDNSAERTAFACIGAAVIQAKATCNGNTPLTRALSLAYSSTEGQGASRLRRLLACSTTEECCSCLRPLFRLIAGKTNVSIDYAQLLDDLLVFPHRSERIKAKWATSFYQREGRKEQS